MKIEQLTTEKVPQFMELYESLVWSDFPDWSKESKKKWIAEDYSPKFWKEAIEEKYPILVAVEDNKFVGYIAVESINFGVAYFGWIGVLPKYRKKKIAQKLVSELVNVCRSKKLHKIELETQLPELIPFFLKQGFSLEGVRRKSWQKLDNFMFGMSI